MKISLSILAAWLLLGNAFGQTSAPAQPTDYEVTNLKALNSKELDYCAVPFGSGVVFTSTRAQGNLFSCTSDFNSGHYSDLYFSRRDAEGNYAAPEKLEGDLNGRYHDGTATFTIDETVMYFSRNNRKGSNSKGNIGLKIYEGKWKKGHWSEVQELPFNSDDFATCHPSLTPNGTFLYFASNRPGGYGGMDIYVVERKPDGWGTPVNMGGRVNTSGNEIFPFISPGGVLYWSSNGLPGQGGLDVFSMPISNGELPVRTALPAPINSPHDDFAYTANLGGTAGFLTSNRPGGLGKDDLYAWKFLGQKSKPIFACVIDQQTGARISDAQLEIKLELPPGQAANPSGLGSNVSFLEMQARQADGKEYLVLVPYEQGQAAPSGNETSESCRVPYRVEPGQFYTVTVKKPGYHPYVNTVSAEEMLLGGPEWLIPIEAGPVAMRGRVQDKRDNSPIALANVKIVNACNGKTQDVRANEQGEFEFPVDCNCDYEIMASKGSYHYDHEMLYSYDTPCEANERTVLLYLEKNREEVAPAPELRVGEVIRLDDLYYDYDKFFIRSDAAEELDKVVGWMRKYPSLELELRSHTDARGSDDYNRQLSQNRAQAAVDYIVSRGIERRRLVAAGYGETRPVNRCINGVSCSETEHQRNRRTEIKITKFAEEGVRVED